jgi:hypothetical protein
VSHGVGRTIRDSALFLVGSGSSNVFLSWFPSRPMDLSMRDILDLVFLVPSFPYVLEAHSGI